MNTREISVYLGHKLADFAAERSHGRISISIDVRDGAATRWTGSTETSHLLERDALSPAIGPER